MASRIFFGIPVSAGVAIGRTYCLNRNHFSGVERHAVPKVGIPVETARLDRAFDAACRELEHTLSCVPDDLQDHSAIIASHLMMLKDRKFRQRALDHVAAGINAEWALERAGHHPPVHSSGP